MTSLCWSKLGVSGHMRFFLAATSSWEEPELYLPLVILSPSHLT